MDIKGLTLAQGQIIIELCNQVAGVENAKKLIPIYDAVISAMKEEAAKDQSPAHFSANA